MCKSLDKFGKINRNDRYFYIFTVFWLSRGYAARILNKAFRAESDGPRVLKALMSMHQLLITKLVTRQDRFHMQRPFVTIVYRVSIRFTMNLLLLDQLSLCFQVISVSAGQLSSI